MFNGPAFNKVAFNAGDTPPVPPPLTGEGELLAIEQRVYTPEFRGGFAWNMQPFNEVPFNAFNEFIPLHGIGELLAIEQEVADVEPSFELIAIEQTVALFSDGAEELIGIEQIVDFYLTGSGQVIEIEQTVRGLGSGQIIEIEQRVQSPASVSGLVARGWEAFVALDGHAIGCLHAQIQVTRTEGGASLMEVTNIPALGIQNIDTLAGKTITCDIQTTAGLFRIFTGKVDVPHINLIEKKITLNCTDNRVELINSTMAIAVSTVGYWSSVIFSTPKDVAEELEQRLTTVPIAVDFDPYGNYSITPKQAKASPDYVLTGIPPDGVYYRDPTVEYTSRANITNHISINFQYRFARLYHMEKLFSWTSPIANNFCLFLQQGYTFAQRTMIEQAVLSAGWPIRGPIAYTPIQPSGWYGCPAFGGGTAGQIAWSTVAMHGAVTKPVLDPSTGLQLVDSDGNPVTQTVNVGGGTDYGPTFANGAQWRGTTRWVQTVVEHYDLIVLAPQSIAQYGQVDAANQYASEDTTDTAAWETYKTYNNPYSKIDTSYFVDTATSRGSMNGAVITAVNIAKTTILNLHRDTRVSISRFIWPQVDLKHTVEINATITNGGALRARGKVFNISHRLDCGTGEGVTNVTLALSRSQGAQADTPIGVPLIAADTPDFGSPNIVLGNHYGEDPAGHPEWNGRIGNKFVGFFRTTFAEQFIVDTNRIPDALRQDKDKFTTGGYNVGIPNDLLEITF